VRFVGRDNLELGGFVSIGHGQGVDEMHHIGASEHVGQVALCETSKFIGAMAFSLGSLGTF
jgi:hypothetical protein